MLLPKIIIIRPKRIWFGNPPNESTMIKACSSRNRKSICYLRNKGSAIQHTYSCFQHTYSYFSFQRGIIISFVDMWENKRTVKRSDNITSRWIVCTT